jgi:hypothetical protein
MREVDGACRTHERHKKIEQYSYYNYSFFLVFSFLFSFVSHSYFFIYVSFFVLFTSLFLIN